MKKLIAIAVSAALFTFMVVSNAPVTTQEGTLIAGIRGGNTPPPPPPDGAAASAEPIA